MCRVEGCDRPVLRRAYCSPHYQRLMRHGDPLAGGRYRDKDRQVEPCQVDGCDRHRYSAKLCTTHWGRLQRYGDATLEPPVKMASVCTIEGCERSVSARGWCMSHYSKWRRHGDPQFVSTPTTRRRAEKRQDRDGYVRLYRPEHPNARKDGYVSEHTVVMTETLGRALLPSENVHHRNGTRNDNRPENLELWARCQPSGQRVRDLIEFANKITERYGTEPAAYP